MYKGSNFGVLFEREVPLHIVAHEVHHLTLEILTRHEIPVNPVNDEVAALLHGYLFRIVYADLVSAKVKLTNDI